MPKCASKPVLTHWLFSSNGGRPIVVKQTRKNVRERIDRLRQRMHIPDGCLVTKHVGWSRCSWFSNEWFRIAADVDLELLELEDFISHTVGGRPPQ